MLVSKTGFKYEQVEETLLPSTKKYRQEQQVPLISVFSVSGPPGWVQGCASSNLLSPGGHSAVSPAPLTPPQ